MRIDLFVSPGCPSCPTAREAIRSFVRDHPGVEVHEWDLSADPGPAVGRGIFATPTVLLDGVHVVPGVPSASDLTRHLDVSHERRAPPARRPPADSLG
jgi:hypothetical protein